MDPDWGDTIFDITAWLSTRRERPDFAFGHIQAPPAMGKNIHVPYQILWHLRYKEILIIHAVPSFKKDAIAKQLGPMIDYMDDHAAMDGKAVTSEIRTVTYETILSELQGYRDKGAWNARARNTFWRSTLILFDINLDFPAELLLCLNAAVVFTATYPAQNPRVSMRLATMSREPLHPLIAGLYELWDDRDTHNFRLPISVGHAFNSIHVEEGSMSTILETMKAVVNYTGVDQAHTIIRFDDMGLIPDEWKDDLWMQEVSRPEISRDRINYTDIANWETPHVMLSLPTSSRMINPQTFPGIMHIIPSQVLKRTIFDRMTGQAVEVILKMSMSDKQHQMDFSRRCGYGKPHVYVYTPDNYLLPSNSDSPRRMDATGRQLGGLISALANFGAWPAKTMDMIHLFSPEEQSAIREMIRRLQLQGLLRAPEEDSIIRFGLTLPPEVHDLFFKLLPGVHYDSRIAHFLALPSTPRLVQVKVQTAAAFLGGLPKLVYVDWDMQGLDLDLLKQIRKLAASGRTAKIAKHGTVWSYLGLMKHTWAKYSNGMCDPTSPSTTVDERVRVSKSICETWENHHLRLSGHLRENGISFEPIDDIFNEPHGIEEGEYESICWDFIQAYACQIAVVEFVDSRPTITDFVSRATLNYIADILILIPWEELAKKEMSPLFGFYTEASRDSKTGTTAIWDWNWIPTKVWERWNQSLEATGRGGTASFQTPHVFSENLDEV